MRGHVAFAFSAKIDFVDGFPEQLGRFWIHMHLGNCPYHSSAAVFVCSLKRQFLLMPVTDSVDAEECHNESPDLPQEAARKDDDDNEGTTSQLQFF